MVEQMRGVFQFFPLGFASVTNITKYVRFYFIEVVMLMHDASYTEVTPDILIDKVYFVLLHFPNTPVSQTMEDVNSFFANQPASVPEDFKYGFRYEQNETLAKLEALDSKEIMAETRNAELVKQVTKPRVESVETMAGELETDAQETLGYGLAGLAVIVAYLLSSAQ